MKLIGTVREEITVDATTIIVEFQGDKRKQHFEVKCNFKPYIEKIRQWDTWEFNIRFESEIFTESKTGQKSYFTHLICDSANEISSPYSSK